MWVVAYALARCGRHDELGGAAMPPAWLGNVGWGNAYGKFYNVLGDGRSDKSFANSLKNARDIFDAHVESGRVGWVDHGADHKAYPPTGIVKRILDEWSERSDEELQAVALAILAGETSAPTSNQTELDRRTRVARKKQRARPEGNAKPQKVGSSGQSFIRDPAVRAWVLEGAKGICEACEQPAPFLDGDGYPFLEVHHVVTLADGGPDVVENAVAICPNCHRRLHLSADREAFRASLFLRVPRLSAARQSRPA